MVTCTEWYVLSFCGTSNAEGSFTPAPPQTREQCIALQCYDSYNTARQQALFGSIIILSDRHRLCSPSLRNVLWHTTVQGGSLRTIWNRNKYIVSWEKMPIACYTGLCRWTYHIVFVSISAAFDLELLQAGPSVPDTPWVDSILLLLFKTA